MCTSQQMVMNQIRTIGAVLVAPSSHTDTKVHSLLNLAGDRSGLWLSPSKLNNSKLE